MWSLYRGGPIKTAISSGIDQALWDITGKCWRARYKLWAVPPATLPRLWHTQREDRRQCDESGPRGSRTPFSYVEGMKMVGSHRALRRPSPEDGKSVDGIDMARSAAHRCPPGKILEPYHPWFYEETSSRSTSMSWPRSPGRLTSRLPPVSAFTKWLPRDSRKRAASILQPDICYAGGITELRLIAGMAESYIGPLAPHNPNGPAHWPTVCKHRLHPNFLVQERGDAEHTSLLAKPLPPVANGHRPLLTDPGLGITIDEEKLKAEVGEPRPYRAQYDPDDGSVVDW